MTKRDYLRISGTMRYVRDLKTTDADTLDLLAYAFANELSYTMKEGRKVYNLSFDKVRFMLDCGCPA